MNEHDNIEQQLSAAGRRLRAEAPDDVTTREALRTATMAPQTHARPDHRPWWPLAWAGGLTAAALIAAIVLIGGDPQDTIRELPSDTAAIDDDAPDPDAAPVPTPTGTPATPASSAPSTDSAPGTSDASNDTTVVVEFRDADCFRLSLDAPDRRIGSAAGCVPAGTWTADRLFVTELDQEIYRIDLVDTSSDTPSNTSTDISTAGPIPELTIERLPDWGTASCGIIDTLRTLSSSDVVVEILGCDRSDPSAPVAVAARIPQSVEEQPGYFSTPGRNTSGPVSLTAPIELAGVIGVDVLFGSPVEGYRCALILPAARAAWSEQCWGEDAAPVPALAMLDGRLIELDLLDESAPQSVLLDARGLPPVGCGLDELRELMSADEAATRLVFTGAICAELNATLTFSGPLASNVGGDGGFIEFERAKRFDSWTAIGRGTALEALPSLAIPAFEVWSQWPGQTRSFPFDPAWVDSAGGTAAEIANQVVEGLNALAPSEFPANARAVAVLDRLVVVQEDTGGDDSVSGAVHYVHLADDGTGVLAIRDWFVSSICGRSAGPTELCI